MQAIFETTLGNITCTLFPDKAPITVDNFIGLATGTKDWKNPASGATMHNRPLYDGTVFHRVIPNFMIQGGDPLGNGSGSPGYQFPRRDQRSDLRSARTAGHGQQRAEHQWLAVLHHRSARRHISTATTTYSASATTSIWLNRSPAFHRSAQRPAIQSAEDRSREDHRPAQSRDPGQEDNHNAGAQEHDRNDHAEEINSATNAMSLDST